MLTVQRGWPTSTSTASVLHSKCQIQIQIHQLIIQTFGRAQFRKAAAIVLTLFVFRLADTCCLLTCLLAVYVHSKHKYRSDRASRIKIVTVTCLVADEFEAGSSAVLNILEYSSEDLHQHLMDVMTQIPPAASQASMHALLLRSLHQV